MKKYFYLTFAGVIAFTLAASAQTKPGTQKKSQPKTQVKPKPQNTKSVKKQKQVNFIDTDYIKFHNLIVDSNKLGVVYLYFEDHRPSENMTKNFSDPEIVNIIDSNYYTFRANVRLEVEQALNYAIQDVPCIILLDRNHKEFDRLYGYKDAAELRRFLRQLTD